MTIEWERVRIRSNEVGYVVERRLNPTRWRSISHYSTLAEATQSLLQYRIRTETSEYVVKAIEHASARASTAKLIQMVSLISKEVFEALDDQNR